jgi:hypothetical protein
MTTPFTRPNGKSRLHPLGVFLVTAALLLGIALAMASRAIGEPNMEPHATAYHTQDVDA